MTFNGNNLIPATANYANFGGDWSTANSTDIVNLTAATTLTGSGNMTIHALRVAGNFNQDLGGRTVVLGSGGLIVNRSTVSNGVLDFGSGPGFIGAYDNSNQGTISATIAGSGGITILGNSQGLNLSANNTFTGGLFVNGGTVTLTNANAANGNNVTVNDLGALAVNVSTLGGATIGGLSGDGHVSPHYQQNASNPRTITISPASGTHTFTGTIRDGNAGSVLSVIKSGSGTQVFGADALASYTGTTTVNAGTLLVNTTLGGPGAGAVTVNSGATLGGNGTINGNTSIAAGGTLAPGNSPGVMTFNGTLTLAGTTAMELNGTNRGTQYDGINTGSGLLTYGGTMNLVFGSQFISGNTTFDLFQIGSGGQTGNFTTITSSSVYTFTLNSGNSYSAVDSFGNTWSFNHSTGDLAVVIPEPSTWALLALGLTAMVVFRRRRTA
jgi:autotransporter-associated beta strand protein